MLGKIPKIRTLPGTYLSRCIPNLHTYSLRNPSGPTNNGELRTDESCNLLMIVQASVPSTESEWSEVVLQCHQTPPRTPHTPHRTPPNQPLSATSRYESSTGHDALLFLYSARTGPSSYSNSYCITRSPGPGLEPRTPRAVPLFLTHTHWT